MPFHIVKAYRSAKSKWADSIKSQPEQEISELQKQWDTPTLLAEQPQSDPAKDLEDLMQRVRKAENKGNIRMTRRPSKNHHDLQSQDRDTREMQDVQELVSLVRSANRMGNIRIFRRKSTDQIRVTKSGMLTFNV